MKYIPSIIAALFITAFMGGAVAFAQGYIPLAPLPGTVDAGTGQTDISTYLSGALKLLIALGAALAILYAIIGGTQYVAAGISPDAKSGAKERIFNAFIGLAIILTSYLLLNSINPKLVEFSFMLPPIEGVAPGAEEVVAGIPPEHTWFSDTAERQQLTQLGVLVNKANCLDIGQGKSVSEGGIGGPKCTSVYQLGNAAISALGLLKGSCSGCNIMVNGGTEYWLHSATTQHRPGNSVVDLNTNSALDLKIKSATSLGVQKSCSSLGPAYKLSGLGAGLYVYEPNHDSNGKVTGHHWHVCY